MWVVQAYEIDAYPNKNTSSFDAVLRTDYRDRIRQEYPAVVAVGDSAIRQLDEEVFSQAAGAKTVIFSAPGSGSAYWYLMIRNQIIASGALPRAVLIFFRGTTLTVPEYRVRGSYFVRLDEIGGSGDQDVFDLAISGQQNWLQMMMARFIPLYAKRAEIYQTLTTVTRDFLPNRLAGCDSACVNRAFEETFDDEKINAELQEDYMRNLDDILYQPDNLKFSSRVGGSLLPWMIRDLRSNGIIPVFIRIKYRSHAEGQTDDPKLTAYLADLESYVKKAGGLFIDLADEEKLTDDMFEDNYHIGEKFSLEVSVVIAEALKEEIEFIIK
ncbi:MAG TPA: hypothetical protein VMW28_02350 [Pelolinea sp.]|nr:hypothetical protein [Pelolinea sp.]